MKSQLKHNISVYQKVIEYREKYFKNFKQNVYKKIKRKQSIDDLLDLLLYFIYHANKDEKIFTMSLAKKSNKFLWEIKIKLNNDIWNVFFLETIIFSKELIKHKKCGKCAIDLKLNMD